MLVRDLLSEILSEILALLLANTKKAFIYRCCIRDCFRLFVHSGVDLSSSVSCMLSVGIPFIRVASISRFVSSGLLVAEQTPHAILGIRPASLVGRPSCWVGCWLHGRWTSRSIMLMGVLGQQAIISSGSVLLAFDQVSWVCLGSRPDRCGRRTNSWCRWPRNGREVASSGPGHISSWQV